MLSSPGAPDPQLVVDAYVSLAEKPAGQRPTRTVVGIDWGVAELNRLCQGTQDKVLHSMQLNETPLNRGVHSV